MTLKEAVLQSLEEINKVTNYKAVYNHIIENKYYNFGTSLTPTSTVSAVLGDFIRKGDSRLKRIPEASGNYSYYLTKNEQNISLDRLVPVSLPEDKKADKFENYEERSLHKLLSSYLKSNSIYSKTIFHEQSSNSKDSNQKWIHPDMVGIEFLNLRAGASNSLLKAVNRVDMFKLISYEIKRVINSDYELKQSFFQAVSNSSWANYGYLVAFKINENLHEEMARLNESFGIGIIELLANPFESKVLFPSKRRNIDFKTIDKLCLINKDFEKFMIQTEKLLTADERYVESTKKELADFCDGYFSQNAEVEEYCKLKNIPIEILKEEAYV